MRQSGIKPKSLANRYIEHVKRRNMMKEISMVSPRDKIHKNRNLQNGFLFNQSTISVQEESAIIENEKRHK